MSVCCFAEPLLQLLAGESPEPTVAGTDGEVPVQKASLYSVWQQRLGDFSALLLGEVVRRRSGCG